MPCLHLATGAATGADSSAANQGEAAPARAVWRAGSRPDQATEGETADSRIEAKARTWPGRGNVPKQEAARTNRSETQLEDQTVTVKKIEADIADLRGRLDTAMTQLAEQKAEVVRILSFNRNIVT